VTALLIAATPQARRERQKSQVLQLPVARQADRAAAYTLLQSAPQPAPGLRSIELEME
jgi:hypothetical protein